MLRLRNVSITFNDVPVIKNLSCDIVEGNCIVIVGANGSGKTTMFNLIAGNIAPDIGTISIDGIDCTKLSAQKRARWISCLLQDTTANTVADMTVAENIAMALYKGKRIGFYNGLCVLKSNSDVQAFFKEIHLEHLLDRQMGSLSGGQRQLIAFIMATLVPPRILLLDEPTAALDLQASAVLLSFAQKFIKKHKITTLLITHDQQVAATFGSQIWTMDHGTIKQIAN